jgi:hypothetical protein
MPEPIPVDENVRELSNFPNQFHQVAMYTLNPFAAMDKWLDLGHGDWIIDNATLNGVIIDLWGDGRAHHSKVEARMAFNYTIMPMELEFLHYKSGMNRHQLYGRNFEAVPFISHMSTYVDDVIGQVETLRDNQGMMPYHRFITQDHTNPAVVGKKRFIEAIYDTVDLLGYDIKFIQKVAWDFDDSKYLENPIFSDAFAG